MNYIIYDLEATCWKGRPPQRQETIEIGAVRVNGFGERTGSFNRFVRPVVNPVLSPFCKELTGIQQRDVDRAATFGVVVEAFQDWIGVFEDEDYLLCSWGDFDKEMLIKDCELHDLGHEWCERYIDLKEQYKAIKRLNKARNLKHATEAEGFVFTGSRHRGKDDADNLAKIFCKYLDEWMY